MDTPGGLLPGAREVRIDTRRVDIQHADNERGGYLVFGEPAEAVMDAFVDMLCPPGLERMEIKSGNEFPAYGCLRTFTPACLAQTAASGSG